jgi:hypothetical protein
MAVAVVTGLAAVLAPATAHGHFVLQSPPSWAEQDAQGNPQKSAPCGQADVQIAAAPTNVVTPFVAGETVTVTIRETTFHPGHYRVVLSETGQPGLPPDPQTTPPGTCIGLDIQDPPIYPVLADGMLAHTDPFDGSQSFQVTLPAAVTCARCTLQVLEFMSAEVGGSGFCFYHHCADVSISARAADAGGDHAADADGGGCACAHAAHGSRPGTWLAGLLVRVALRRRGRRGRA